MIDMPIQAADVFPADVNISSLSAKVANYWPAIEVVKQTWSKNTLQEIMDGQVAVPDSVINESLAEFAAGNDKINSVSIESLGDNKFKLSADIVKTGRINLLCRIEEFVHNDTDNYLKIKVLEKELPDNGTLSWIFSRVSISMAQKVVGKLDFGENITTTVKGNTITADFTKALQNSAAGSTQLFGEAVSDMVIFNGAATKPGCVVLNTELNVSDRVKEMLLRIVQD